MKISEKLNHLKMLKDKIKEELLYIETHDFNYRYSKKDHDYLKARLEGELNAYERIMFYVYDIEEKLKNEDK